MSTPSPDSPPQPPGEIGTSPALPGLSSAPPPPPAAPNNTMQPPAGPNNTTQSPAAPNSFKPPPPGSGGLPPGTLAGLIVGIGIGVLIVLCGVGIFVFLRRQRRRRRGGLAADSGGQPSGPKDDRPTQYWQQNAPPPSDSVADVQLGPTPPLGIGSNAQLLPQFAPHLTVPPSDGSSLGSEKPVESPSPGIPLGLSKNTFSYEELAAATNFFSEANLVGQGGFGYVHKGVLPSGKEVAIKQLKTGSGQGEREFQAEVDIINRVHHKHLVSLLGYCITGAQRLLVYEFVPNRTLEFHLHGSGSPPLDWATRMKIALGSARGLAYLHSDCQPKIIHRDIKASNILIDYDFDAKVADFGLAKFSFDTDTHVSTRVMGTFGYLAPEYASSGKLTDKSDVFSFGVVLLELITGRRPIDKAHYFTDDSMVDWARPLLARALEDGNVNNFVDPRLQKDYDASEMTRMIACAAVCIRHSARRRPRMSQIVRALEGNISLDDLNEGMKPGHSSVYSPYGSSDYDTGQYREDLKKFRKMALETNEHSTTDCSGLTSELGVHPSSSSSGGQ